jgi:hypothetical protein
VGEFLGDHAEVHGGDGGIALAGAVDAVLADQDKGIGDAVEGDGKTAAVAPKALFGVLEFVVMLLECRHEGAFPIGRNGQIPANFRALHFGHRAEARIFTLSQRRKIIQSSRTQDQKAVPYL